MKIIFTICITVLAFVSTQAFALSCAPPNKESSWNLLNRADYIFEGIVTEVSKKPRQIIADSEIKYTVKPTRIFKGETATEFTAYHDKLAAYWSYGYKRNQTGTFILFKRDNGKLYFPGACAFMVNEVWDAYKKEHESK